MECSSCHSTDLVKLSLVYEQGLSELQAQSRLAGLSLGTAGLGFWGGRARTTGTLQTRLSRRLSPPGKMSYWKALVFWFLSFVLVGCVSGYLGAISHISDKLFHQRFNLFGDIYTGSLVFLLWLIWRYNHRVFPARHTRWDRSFICRRCGKIV